VRTDYQYPDAESMGVVVGDVQLADIVRWQQIELCLGNTFTNL
jgi:hypothetical protein